MHIAIVAGETSGDALGAGLIRAIRERAPDACFIGIGGEQMRREGCELLCPMERISVMGLDGLFGKLRGILAIRRDLARRFANHRPAVFVGIDVPDFNLGLELKLKRAGVPTVHYVSPTVWAWRGYRIHKIRRAVSHMLTLFPFEAEYYRQQGVPVTFVGHPMADRSGKPDRVGARAQLGVGGKRVIALLPGSREGEMRRLGGVILDAARLLHQRHLDFQFLLPFANGALRQQFERELRGQAGGLPLTLLDGNAHLAMEAADGVILASGTAALEAALLERPMVVVYKVSRLSHFLARPLVNVGVYAMPNHLLPEPSIPELIQDDATPRNIADAMDGYLDNPRRTQALQRQFARIRGDLQQDANRRAAEVVLARVGNNQVGNTRTGNTKAGFAKDDSAQ